MDAPFGTVILVRDGIARVSVDSAACPRCAAGKGCGAGLFAGGASRREIDVPLDDSQSVRAGDRIRLTLQPGNLWRAAAYAYGLPLAGMVIVPGIAWWLGFVTGDRQAVLLALGGLVAGIWLGRSRLQRDGCLDRLTPSVAARPSPRDLA